MRRTREGPVSMGVPASNLRVLDIFEPGEESPPATATGVRWTVVD